MTGAIAAKALLDADCGCLQPTVRAVVEATLEAET